MSTDEPTSGADPGDQPSVWDDAGDDAADPGEIAAAAAAVTQRRLRELREEIARLDAQVRRVGEMHTGLASSVSEEIAPKVAELSVLRDLVMPELAELRAAVKALVDEAEQAKNPPVDWAAMTAEQAARQWPILARWVGEVLVPWYELTRAELPDCWALHRPVVVELSWLRSAHVQSYLTHSHPHITGEWHVRWRATVLARIKDLIIEQKCRPGEHMVAKEDSPSRRPTPPDPTPTPPQGTRRVMPTPPRYQLAEPRHWWPFYARAFHSDQAWRVAAAAAPEANWTPPPPSGEPSPTSG